MALWVRKLREKLYSDFGGLEMALWVRKLREKTLKNTKKTLFFEVLF